MKRRLVPILLALIVLLVGTGGVLAAGGLLDKREGKAELGVVKASEAVATDAESGPLNVPAVKVEAVESDASLPLTGSLTADEESEVSPQVAGMVKDVLIERGSVVEKGDVLVQLDPTNAENQLAQGEASVEELRVRLGLEKDGDPFKAEEQPEVKTAKAALDLATVTETRYAGMVREGIVSKEVFDQARTERQSAQQRYEQALYMARQLYQSYLTAQTHLRPLRKALEDMTIRAPFSGWVAEKRVSAGEWLAPGKDGVVAVIVKINPLRLVLTVPQQDSAAVKTGQKVRYRVDGFGDRVYEAEVRHVGPSVDASSRSLKVEAVTDNADRSLRPGLFATAELLLPQKTKRLLVPASAVRQDGDVATLYVVQDGTVQQRIAALGQSAGGKVEVLKGLSSGDVVVTAPDKVRDGARVEPVLN